MKIKYKYLGYKERVLTVRQYTLDNLSGDDQERGELETIREGVKNAHAAIGRLLDAFAQKGVFTANEIGNIVEGYIGDEQYELIFTEEK